MHEWLPQLAIIASALGAVVSLVGAVSVSWRSRRAGRETQTKDGAIPEGPEMEEHSSLGGNIEDDGEPDRK